jgi:hypothetical protein
MNLCSKHQILSYDLGSEQNLQTNIHAHITSATHIGYISIFAAYFAFFSGHMKAGI